MYALAFHPDGALAASGGLDAIGRVWDLRTGRSIMVLEGHVKALLALDFAPGGHLLASGSEDHTARVWDLRQRRCLCTLPGHRSLVSQVRLVCVPSASCRSCMTSYLWTVGSAQRTVPGRRSL